MTNSPSLPPAKVAIKMLIKNGEKYNQELEEVKIMTVWAGQRLYCFSLSG